ncbi:MAG TPA: hypothetical protein ENO11_03365 [Desulfobacteraceae bacterium]|nr:hypothetical protein [Desulfobacteraceae bacterium]
MRKLRIASIVVASFVGLCFAMPAAAQHVGILQSAETNDEGTFKLMGAPMMVFGKDGADDEFGFGARGGYGFTERFDVEAKVGFFENSTFAGVDGEYWILQGQEKDIGLDFSITGGVHVTFARNENFDTVGFEITPQISGNVTKNLELCGALDVSLVSVQDAPPDFDDTFTRAHLVPGFEYRLSDALDLVGEIGIGLNDNAFTYASAGIAYYIR